ncbi:YqiA/YcfP family alpha/beta fold hydrolase [Pseudidiomarina aestuarii]|uniref:YqiA/YcfP family alpha/beta fold hydrolase n=1 Tax=Pseudidiomarina aestuarii TaxID=624146 RepID=UPI003A973037
MLLYLHGFESSPASQKIDETRQFLETHQAMIRLEAPQQPASMVAIRQLLDYYIEQAEPPSAVMGSSLGGFWTHYVVSRLKQRGAQVRGVLINPAVRPLAWMPPEPHQRVHPYTKEEYWLGPQDAEVLAAAQDALRDDVELLVLLQAADEVLDVRLAQERYYAQRLILEQGGDHRFQNFPRYLPAVLEFLGVL